MLNAYATLSLFILDMADWRLRSGERHGPYIRKDWAAL